MPQQRSRGITALVDELTNRRKFTSGCIIYSKWNFVLSIGFLKRLCKQGYVVNGPCGFSAYPFIPTTENWEA
ncbi:hypothetical protein OUZ56_019264 [Daphnia magna]|uniref:Uncharacterized protein n=1 Tax=Daphnia magna TaxID=35525 RepID=A0ABQ9ZB39_9CRUS|nr:hypothetical protein OUZ56_019264 [Daphnia magna]